ncbi:hypothetical protein V8E53_011005 [Lactarius tabidus]
MPPKPLEESTGLENYMLYKAAKLLAAVRWVAENPPMPEKEDYLNKMVLEEIMNEWKAASHEQRKPRWDIFTEETIAYVCDQVATENPTWYPHLYVTDLTSYVCGEHPSRTWWRHPIPQSFGAQESATQGSTTLGSSDTDTALQEPDNPSAPAAEVEALPLSAPSPVGLLTQAAKKGKACIVEEPVNKMQARPVKAPAPAPVPSTPPVAGPSKKHKAPRRELSSEVSDSNNNETPTKKVTEMPIFEAMQGAGRALDKDTHQQLNRIEAMLNAICNSNGILPESLPDGDAAHFRYMFKHFRTLQLHVETAMQEGVQGKGKWRLHQRLHQWPDKLEKLTWIIVGQGVKRTIY